MKRVPLCYLPSLLCKTVSVQLVIEYIPDVAHEGFSLSHRATPILSGNLAPFVKSLRNVVSVPCMMPIFYGNTDDNYLRTEPGLYPDILMPINYEGRISVTEGKGNFKIIISQRTLNEIVRLLENDEDIFSLIIQKNILMCEINCTTLISRLLEGEYIDYKNIIKNTFSSVVNINRNQLVRIQK